MASHWPLGRRGTQRGIPLPKGATASLGLQQAWSGSSRLQGPFDHTHFQITHSSSSGAASLTPVFAPAHQQNPGWAERSLKLEDPLPLPTCSRHRPFTPALPQPTQEGGPQQTCSRSGPSPRTAQQEVSPDIHPPHCALPGPSPPLGRLSYEDRHPGTPLAAVLANRGMVHPHA